MDFVSDALFDGQCLRILILIDNYTRESPAIEMDRSLTGKQVVNVLEQIADQRGLPEKIFMDNGPEFSR